MLNPKKGVLCIINTLIRVFAIVTYYNLQSSERASSVFVNWRVKLKWALAFFYSKRPWHVLKRPTIDNWQIFS